MMTVPHPALIEATWTRAEPGREAAAALNELLRALRALLTAREPTPHFHRRMRLDGVEVSS